MLAMPLFMYPTQLIWVDDDSLFLQVVTNQFKNNFDIVAYRSPDECLQSLKNYHSLSASLALFKGYNEYEEYDLTDHMPVDINLSSILALRNSIERSQDAAVMIVDYNMPDKTGVELCEELRGLPFKKILLTGEANHQLAIDAFNNGTIDCFIRKDDPALVTELVRHINRLQIQYFSSVTKQLFTHLEADYKLPFSDPAYIEFFEGWCKENNIREYYLVDKNGTFLTIDNKGVEKYFVTHSDRSLGVFSTLYAEDKEVFEYVELVKQRKKVPFFGASKEAWDYESSEWRDYFYEPQILEGRETYYWFVVDADKCNLLSNSDASI